MNKKNIKFKYDRKIKKGVLSVNGRKISISVHNPKSVTSGFGGYGIHLI